jgi:hypothetical protein
MAASSSSSTAKRKRASNNNDQRSKRTRINDEDLQEIVNMVRKNKSIGRGHIEITPQLVVEIAQMSKDNNVQKTIPKNRRIKENIT